MGRSTKITLAIAAGIIGLIVLPFALTGLDLAHFAFWAPKYEDAKREVFEETQSYQHGMWRDLRNLKMDYKKAEPGSPERRVIKGTILHRVAPVDREDIPSDLLVFIKQLEDQ
jgi:hypothetical protein